jgi:hypothetical protein
VDLDGYDAEDPIGRSSPARRRAPPRSPRPPAADAKLIGFYCPVCGYLRSAEGYLPDPAPLCAGSTARTGRKHEPARMEALLLD